MIVLLDLDGTLTNTAEKSFKPMKDGLEDTVISNCSKLYPGICVID